MRLTRLLLVLIFYASLAGAYGAEPAAPVQTRSSSTVKCVPSINVWIEVDGKSIVTREPVNLESKKRAPFKLISSGPYRGDAVLCNYATSHRDMTTSYSIRCRQPRKVRGYKHSYVCQ
jgi:hypothetical protein